MLKIEHIAKTFNPGTINQKKALRDLSLELANGDFVTVIGGNGAGKSTLLNAVAGVWPVDEGTIEIGGVDVTAMPEYKRAQYIGRVFQDPMMGTAPNMQIEENLALAYRRGKKRTLRWGVTQAERKLFRDSRECERRHFGQRKLLRLIRVEHGNLTAEEPAVKAFPRSFSGEKGFRAL